MKRKLRIFIVLLLIIGCHNNNFYAVPYIFFSLFLDVLIFFVFLQSNKEILFSSLGLVTQQANKVSCSNSLFQQCSCRRCSLRYSIHTEIVWCDATSIRWHYWFWYFNLYWYFCFQRKIVFLSWFV